MIKITLYKKAITSIGHAGYQEKGKDIYCAGVSAILLGAMNWFDPLDIQYEILDGLVKFKLINELNDNLFKLDLLKIQLKSFCSKENKKYISIKNIEKECYEK